METLYESYIQTLHPNQLLILEEFLEDGTASTKAQKDFKRTIRIILQGGWLRIKRIIEHGIKTSHLRELFENHPKLMQLIGSIKQTVEGTREVSKEHDFDWALRKLYELRRVGFLPNIITLKRLIIKTKWELSKLKIIESIIVDEGISKNKSYLFYATLIQSGSFRGNHKSSKEWTFSHRWAPHESIRTSKKYTEAIAAGLSPDFAFALAQGLFGGAPRWSDIHSTGHGKFRWRIK